MRFSSLGLGISLFLGAAVSVIPQLLPGEQPAQAVQFVDGTTAFEYPPRVIAASVTNFRSRQRDSIYFFTIAHSEKAGEPLQKLMIEPRDGVRYQWPFRVEDSLAFVGTRFDRGDELAFSSVAQDVDTQVVTLVLDTPVPPGTTFTIRLRPQRTPRRGGVYLYGVTAFPAGEQGRAQFAGFGRLHFFDTDDDFRILRANRHAKYP